MLEHIVQICDWSFPQLSAFHIDSANWRSLLVFQSFRKTTTIPWRTSSTMTTARRSICKNGHTKTMRPKTTMTPTKLNPVQVSGSGSQSSIYYQKFRTIICGEWARNKFWKIFRVRDFQVSKSNQHSGAIIWHSNESAYIHIFEKLWCESHFYDIENCSCC